MKRSSKVHRTGARDPQRGGRFMWLWGLLFVALATGALQAQSIDNFDQRSLGQLWTAIGKSTTARRVPVPEGINQAGVEGHYVEFTMDPGGRLLTRTEANLPAVPPAAAIRFVIQASAASATEPAVLECQFYCGKRQAWRWCKFELTDTDWHQIELPLRFFRHSHGAYVDWSEVSRVGFMTRTRGSFRLDNVELAQDEDGVRSELTAAELGEIAFGPQALCYESRHFTVVTNRQELEHESILAALERLHDQVARDFPELPPLSSQVPVLIFAEHQDYQDFFGKLEPRIRSSVNRPKTPGYTLFGVACCVYSDEFGAIRPIYVHEACHALIARQLGLGNQGEWLHEGLANHYQTTLLGQDREAPARYVLMNPVAWTELLSGQGLSLDRYAHVMFFVEWMMADPKRKEVFAVALKQMRQKTSTRFDELLVQLLEQTEAELQASYKVYVESVATAAK